jgi:putative MATE family efflux protein
MRQEGGTDAPLWRAMLAFLLPLVASNMLQSLSGTAGAIYYGQMIGVSGIAAAAAFFPIFFFLISFLIGFSNAAAVLVGQAFGARDADQARRVAGTTLTVCVLSGATIAIVCSVFARAMLTAIGTPAEILADALAYARVMFIFTPLLFVFIAYSTLLRGVGDTRSPLYTLLISTTISLTLVPAFIRGVAGLPRLGVTSAPYAGSVAYVVSLSCLFLHLRRTSSPLAPGRALLAQLGIDWQVLRALLKLGVPSGMQIVLVSLSEIAVISFVNAFGPGATAAYGAVNQIIGYVQFPAISVGISASIFAAQAIGARRAEQLPHITRTAMGLSLALGGILVALAYVFSSEIVSWFIAAPDTAAIARRLLEITLWSYLVFGIAQVLQGVMRGSGAVLWPTAISIAAIWGVEVPVAYVLSHRIGIDGVWIAYPVAFTAGLLLLTVFYAAVWRKRTHVPLI